MELPKVHYTIFWDVARIAFGTPTQAVSPTLCCDAN
jgi:hypothetical protein